MSHLAFLVAASLLIGSTPTLAGQPRGATLYRNYCAGCHGPDGGGDGPDAQFFADPPRDLYDGVLRRYDTPTLVRRIRDGRPLALTRDPRRLDRWLDDTGTVLDFLEQLARTGPPVVSQGRQLWATRCERCHGRFGVPPEDAPNEPPADLSDPAVQRRFDEAALREAVRHGVPGMPALERPPSGAEVTPLAAYVRLLRPGMPLYHRVCASCHGDDGRPADLPPGFREPVVTFDATWLAGTTRQERETAVWHMLANERPRMPHFAPTLRERDVSEIIEWLRTNHR